MVLCLLACLVLRLRHCGQELCGQWDLRPPVVTECIIPGPVISPSCLQFVVNDRYNNKKELSCARVSELGAQRVQRATGGRRAIGSDPAPIRGLRQRLLSRQARIASTSVCVGIAAKRRVSYRVRRGSQRARLCDASWVLRGHSRWLGPIAWWWLGTTVNNAHA